MSKYKSRRVLKIEIYPPIMGVKTPIFKKIYPVVDFFNTLKSNGTLFVYNEVIKIRLFPHMIIANFILVVPHIKTKLYTLSGDTQL